MLFIGDINVDLMLGGLASPPLIDREVTCSSFSLTMGSSVVITAANYAGLGGRSSVAGLAGRDDYGDYMMREMQARGLDTSLVQRTSEERTGVTVNLIHASTRTQITYPGTIATFEDTAEIEKRIGEFDHAHFSGVYQQHRFRPHLTRLLDLLHEAGVTTSLDPQWDPREEWELLERWLPRLDYFFVNRDEACSITGQEDPTQALRELAESTACPICKVGEAGALLFDGPRCVTVPPYPVSIRDTTGAGDAFAAGFLYARLERQTEMVDAVRFANAAAARNCTMEGGVNSCPPYEEIQRFMETHSERAYKDNQ